MGFTAPPLRPRLTIPIRPHTPPCAELTRRRTTPASYAPSTLPHPEPQPPLDPHHHDQTRTPLTALLSSPASMPTPQIHTIHDPKSNTHTFIVADPVTEDAVIINPVLNFDPASMVISTESADEVLRVVEEEGYTVTMILETGVRRRSVGGGAYVRRRIEGDGGGKVMICVGENARGGIGHGSEGSDGDAGGAAGAIGGGKGPSNRTSSSTLRPAGLKADEGAFDVYFGDYAKFRVGNIVGSVMNVFLSSPPSSDTPQHPESDLRQGVAYIIGRNVFLGDLRRLDELSHDSRRKIFDFATDTATSTGAVATTRAGAVASGAQSDMGIFGVPTAFSGKQTQGFITVDQLLSLDSGNANCSVNNATNATNATNANDGTKSDGANLTPPDSTTPTIQPQLGRDEQEAKRARHVDVMHFYATRINARGGMIPRKVHLDLPSVRGDGGAGGEGHGETEDKKGKGKENDMDKSKRKSKEKEAQLKPLLIPRRLEWLLC